MHKAVEKGVVNVARYYHHETVRVAGEDDGVCKNVCKGLDITKATNYNVRRSIISLNTSGLYSSTRKGRSTSVVGRKRSSTNTPLLPSKRSCSSSLTKDRGNSAEWDQVHRRVILSDYGKPIYKTSSLVSMLSALEGCIDGYKSLYTQTGMIQSDISISNLIMNEDDDNPSWQAFIIDLDLAIREQREWSSGARGKTGTRAFMAIGVLYGEKHSFMHDLESFFWVLFWICIHYNGLGGEKMVTEFERWNYKNTTELAKLKFGTIGDKGDFLKTADEKFTSYYHTMIPCVNRLQKVVFPGAGRWKEEDKKLYSQMKEILQEAQEDLKDTVSS